MQGASGFHSPGRIRLRPNRERTRQREHRIQSSGAPTHSKTSRQRRGVRQCSGALDLQDESGRRQLSSRGAETRRLIKSGPDASGPHSKSKKQSGRSCDRPVLLATDFVNNYAVRVLRNMRRVLAPNGSSSNAPAIIVVGSGTGNRVIDSMFALAGMTLALFQSPISTAVS